MYVISGIILIIKGDFRESTPSSLQYKCIIDLLKDYVKSIVRLLAICAVFNKTYTHSSVKAA